MDCSSKYPDCSNNEVPYTKTTCVGLGDSENCHTFKLHDRALKLNNIPSIDEEDDIPFVGCLAKCVSNGNCDSLQFDYNTNGEYDYGMCRLYDKPGVSETKKYLHSDTLQLVRGNTDSSCTTIDYKSNMENKELTSTLYTGTDVARRVVPKIESRIGTECRNKVLSGELTDKYAIDGYNRYCDKCNAGLYRNDPDRNCRTECRRFCKLFPLKSSCKPRIWLTCLLTGIRLLVLLILIVITTFLTGLVRIICMLLLVVVSVITTLLCISRINKLINRRIPYDKNLQEKLCTLPNCNNTYIDVMNECRCDDCKPSYTISSEGQCISRDVCTVDNCKQMNISTVPTVSCDCLSCNDGYALNNGSCVEKR